MARLDGSTDPQGLTGPQAARTQAKRFEVSVFPILEGDDGGLTANRGGLCAGADSDDLAEAMRQAGQGAAAWMERGETPIAFDVRVVVA